jgi:hypothetical protein
MEKAVVEHFIADLVDHLKKSYPDKTGSFSDKALFDECRNGIERAKLYGLEAASHWRVFMEIRLQRGANFDRQEWAAAILNNASLFPHEEIFSPDQKVRASTGAAAFRGNRVGNRVSDLHISHSAECLGLRAELKVRGPFSRVGSFEEGKGEWGFGGSIVPQPGAAGLHLHQFSVPGCQFSVAACGTGAHSSRPKRDQSRAGQ